MDDDRWAVREFGRAVLGDARRTARLVDLATTLGERPTASLPDGCGTVARLKAAYRFFENDAIDPGAVLASHVAATYDRMALVPLILAVQDTTLLDYTHHPATTGLGPLDHGHQGLLVHSTLAITPDRLPLGLLAQQVWARDPAQPGRRATRKTRPIAEKESHKWLTSLEAVTAARARCPTTRLVSVGDREADVYDLFLAPRPDGVDLLVRAAWDRRVAGPQPHLWHAVAQAPVAATATVCVPKRGAQPARRATLHIRFCRVHLRPPKHRARERLPSVTVWAVWAVEADPPTGVPPLEWLLLTTCPVATVDDALERLEWYTGRWGIEVWHYVLKSGCRIEARQLEDGDHLRRCLSLYSVLAWRVLYSTLLARSVPHAPCTVLLQASEWQALYCAIHDTTMLPAQPPTLAQAVTWIARLGGFHGRARAAVPGVTVLWRGFQHLADLTRMYQVFRPPPHHSLVGNP
jgi:Transposase DNA-binding/Transposase Tn5 dimerisation domain